MRQRLPRLQLEHGTRLHRSNRDLPDWHFWDKPLILVNLDWGHAAGIVCVHQQPQTPFQQDGTEESDPGRPGLDLFFQSTEINCCK